MPLDILTIGEALVEVLWAIVPSRSHMLQSSFIRAHKRFTEGAIR